MSEKPSVPFSSIQTSFGDSASSRPWYSPFSGSSMQMNGGGSGSSIESKYAKIFSVPSDICPAKNGSLNASSLNCSSTRLSAVSSVLML